MNNPHLEGLIPCPFCGSCNVVAVRFLDDVYLPKCNGCSAIIHPAGGFSTPALAIAAWNRRTLAALPGGGVDGWQPIESAPKDGTVVFVTVAAKDAEIEKGYFNRGAWYVVNNGDYFDGGHGNDYRTTSVPGNGNYGLPTHWRPLPSAPTPNPHEADRNG